MQTYKTKNNDILDGIIWNAFGYCDDNTLETVYGLNYGLSSYGPVFPPGVNIILPDSVAATQAADSGTVKLWD